MFGKKSVTMVVAHATLPSVAHLKVAPEPQKLSSVAQKLETAIVSPQKATA